MKRPLTLALYSVCEKTGPENSTPKTRARSFSSVHNFFNQFLNSNTFNLNFLMMKRTLTNLSAKLVLIAGLLFISTGAFAQVMYKDTVCAGTQDVVYGVNGAVATSTYTWFLDDPTAGTIDNSITANNGEIEIDWGTTTGVYYLSVFETSSDGCIGDTTQLEIEIFPLPTVALVTTPVCEYDQSTITFTFTGQAPWVVDFTDGTNTWTETATASPHTFTLPIYATSQSIDVTGLTDANGCSPNAGTMPTGVGVTIWPKPSTGAIYHY